MRSLRSCLWLGLLGLLAMPGSARAEALDSAAVSEFLQRLVEQRTSAEAWQVDFQEERRSPLLQEPVRTEGTLYFASPSALRREVRQPTPSLTISNGRTLWMVYPDFQEVEEYPLERLPQIAESLRLVGEVLQGKELPRRFLLQGERLDKQTRLILQPRGTARRQLRQATVIFSQDGKAHRMELELSDGTRTRIEFLRERPFSPPPGFFEFRPPENFRISRPLG